MEFKAAQFYEKIFKSQNFWQNLSVKFLGIDFGGRRVGIAVGDLKLKVAVPVTILKNDAALFSEIAEICAQKKIDKIVVGLPLSVRSKENLQSETARNFGKKLAEEIEIPVEFFDERFSSRETAQRLKFFGEKKLKMKKDATAAAVFLQTFLEKFK